MENNKNIHVGHRERLRQRVMAEGLDNFKPHELLEFLLYYAIPRQNVNQIAHSLLDAFGSISDVFKAEPEDLIRVKGVGEHAARWIHLVGKCINACGEVLSSDIVDFSAAARVEQKIRSLGPLPIPSVLQLCLNREYGLLYRRIIAQSTDWGEPEILREAMKDVLGTGARHVIMVLLTEEYSIPPSEYTLQTIRDYSVALDAADSHLLDVILSDGKSFSSLTRLGIMAELQSGDHPKKACKKDPQDLYPVSE